MKIIFFGTPDYVIPVVEALNKSFRTRNENGVVAVVTQPPRPIGRGHKIDRSEVDHWAYKHKISILYDFDNLPQADIGVVAAYGKIIPKHVINHFPLGILNIHPSLLPKYRGASPVQAAITSGETQTGVTVIKMDELMDHGAIVSSFKDEILKADTSETLRDRLFEKSAKFIVDLIPNYLKGKIKLKEQVHNDATFTKLLTREHGFINPVYLKEAIEGETSKKNWKIQYIKDYSQVPDVNSIERFIRAMAPWPGAWTTVTLQNDQRRLKILSSHIEDKKLVFDKVQMEGKDPVSWEEFKRGYPKISF